MVHEAISWGLGADLEMPEVAAMYDVHTVEVVLDDFGEERRIQHSLRSDGSLQIPVVVETEWDFMPVFIYTVASEWTLSL